MGFVQLGGLYCPGEIKVINILIRTKKGVKMNILRCKDVAKKTGLAKSTIYEMIKGRSFPAPIQLGPRTTGWVEDEIEDWLVKKVAERDKSTLEN